MGTLEHLDNSFSFSTHPGSPSLRARLSCSFHKALSAGNHSKPIQAGSKHETTGLSLLTADEGRFKEKLVAMVAGTEGDFHGMKLSADQVKRLCAALHPKVAILVVNDCDLGDSGATSLSDSMKQCTALTTLWLTHNHIGDSGAKSLADSLKRCTALEMLFLGDNQIGDSGATYIADALKHCTALERLYLDNNQIGASGAMSIANSIPYSQNLTTVFLFDNKISPSVQAVVDAALESPRRAASALPPKKPSSVPAATA